MHVFAECLNDRNITVSSIYTIYTPDIILVDHVGPVAIGVIQLGLVGLLGVLAMTTRHFLGVLRRQGRVGYRSERRARIDHMQILVA